MTQVISGPCSACGDGDTAMKYHNHDKVNDPLLAAANSAWLDYARGTYSETDRKIFVEGFRRGWQARLHCSTGVSKADVKEYLREANK